MKGKRFEFFYFFKLIFNSYDILHIKFIINFTNFVLYCFSFRLLFTFIFKIFDFLFNTSIVFHIKLLNKCRVN